MTRNYQPLVFGMALLLVGCSTAPTDYTKLLEQTPSCCAQLNQVKYTPLKHDRALNQSIGGKKSMARQFAEGKSYFLPLQLPTYAGPYELQITSLPDGGNLFIPKVKLLDSTFQTKKVINPQSFQYSNGTAEHSFFVNSDQGYRYMLLYTTPKLLGNEKSMRMATSSTTTIASGPYMFMLHDGHDKQHKVRTSAGGLLRVEVKKYAPRKLQ